MVETVSENRIIYRVDEAAVNKAERKIKDLQNTNEKFAKSIQKNVNATESFQQALAKAESRSRLDGIVADAVKLKKETNDAATAAKRLAQELERVGATEDEIRNAATQFNFLSNQEDGGGRRGRGLLGQVGLAVRNAPAVPIPGLGITTEPISKAAIALDNFGISITQLGQAGLIAAPFVIALAFAINKLQEDIKKNVSAIQSAVDTVRQVNQFLLEGATTQDVTARIEELQRAREAEVRTLENTKVAAEQFAQSGLFDWATKTRDDYQEFVRQQENSTNLINQYDLEIRKLNEGVESGITATNDAAEAEKRLATERTQSVLAEADLAAQVAQAEIQARGATTDELERLKQAEQDRLTVINAERQALIDSGDSSKEVTEQIAQLEKQAEAANARLEVFNNTVAKTAEDDKGLLEQAKNAATIEQARQQAIGATSEQLKSLVEGEKSRIAILQAELSVLEASNSQNTETKNRIAQLRNELDNATQRLNIFKNTVTGTGEAAAGAGGGLVIRIKKRTQETSKLIDAQQKQQDRLLDLQREFYEAQNEIGIDAQRDVEDLRIETSRSLEDALREGTFLDIANIQRDAARQREDIERETDRARIDLARDTAQKLLEAERQFWQERLRLAQEASKSGSGSRFRTSFFGAVPS